MLIVKHKSMIGSIYQSIIEVMFAGMSNTNRLNEIWMSPYTYSYELQKQLIMTDAIASLKKDRRFINFSMFSKSILSDLIS